VFPPPGSGRVSSLPMGSIIRYYKQSIHQDLPVIIT